jgi:hypothetical protein
MTPDCRSSAQRCTGLPHVRIMENPPRSRHGIARIRINLTTFPLRKVFMRIPSVLPALVCGLTSACLVSNPLHAESVPPQLRNKTVSASWIMQRTVMTPRGERQSPQIPISRTIYISSAGRFFVKASRNSHDAEVAPGDKTPRGGARDMRFSGGTIVGMAQFGAAAGRMIISFDPGYSSCNVQITYGKPNGQRATFRNRRGLEIEVLDVRYSGQTCSIRDGNVFAN